MQTKYLRDSAEDIRQAAAILRSGGLVGIPTETVYGLGANGLSSEAVKKIFAAKGRPGNFGRIVAFKKPRNPSGLPGFLNVLGGKIVSPKPMFSCANTPKRGVF